MYSRWLWPFAAACALTTAGCSPATGLYPVRGQVLYQGKSQPPVPPCRLFAKEWPTPFQEQTPQGVVQEDGSFMLAGAAGTGAAPGEYIVLIEWKEGAGKADAAAAQRVHPGPTQAATSRSAPGRCCGDGGPHEQRFARL